MSSILFENGRHEALRGDAWDEARVRATITTIAADLEASRNADGSWPLHPSDDEGDTPPGGFKGLYLGSAGVLWALWHLAREGAVTLGFDPADAIGDVHARYLVAPDSGAVVPAFFSGEAGILLALWRMTGSQDAADRLFACVEANIANPSNEAFLGASGTTIAALHLFAATGEARWRQLVCANVERLLHLWRYDERLGCHLWTQDLYGWQGEMLGAGHGFAGNAYALLRAAPLLEAGQRDMIFTRIAGALRATALRDEDGANWPVATVLPRPGRPNAVLQWCHGGPGIVTAMTPFPPGHSADVESLLAAAGEAIWHAGPLSKGYSLCHGTAGNGYAFLELHRRTGDTVWLERARSFAMHSMAQRDALRQGIKQGRYTLWTGDAGLATYLWCCIKGAAGLPALDLL